MSPITNRFRDLLPPVHTITIKVMGLGGGGQNAVDRMIEHGIEGNIQYIAANTDRQVLNLSQAPTRILLGEKRTRGLGAGGQPEVGKMAAHESRAEIRTALTGADLVFLTAGLGGGTGTGAIQVAAEEARALGAITTAIVTMPFDFEGTVRARNAATALTELERICNTVVVVENNRLLQQLPRTIAFRDALYAADEVLRQGIQAMTELITDTGNVLVSVGFADIQRLLNNSGKALMAIGTGHGPNAAQQALNQALNNPLNELGDIARAGGVLIHFTAGVDLSLHDIQMSTTALHDRLGAEIEIRWGARVQEHLHDAYQVILIVTGIRTPNVMAEDLARVRSARTRRPAEHAPEPAGVVYSEITLDSPHHLFDEVLRQPAYAEVSTISSGLGTRTIDPNDLDLPAFLRRRQTAGGNQ